MNSCECVYCGLVYASPDEQVNEGHAPVRRAQRRTVCHWCTRALLAVYWGEHSGTWLALSRLLLVELERRRGCEHGSVAERIEQAGIVPRQVDGGEVAHGHVARGVGEPETHIAVREDCAGVARRQAEGVA